MRNSDSNPNWRGGLCGIFEDDEIADLPTDIKQYLMKRFNAKYYVDSTGCWMWSCAVDKDGYGRFGVGSKSRKAHRISYVLHRGKIGKLLICHTCDVKGCVNPEHMFLGTVKDNVQDYLNKGNRIVGQSKFSDEQVKYFREQYFQRKQTQRELAALYGVHKETIWKIIHGITYAHV